MAGLYLANDSASLEKSQNELSRSRRAYYKELLVYSEVLELLTGFDEAQLSPTNGILEDASHNQAGLMSSAENYETLRNLALAQAAERLQMQLPVKEAQASEAQGKHHQRKDEDENDKHHEKRASERFAGSRTHLLGVRPEDIQEGSGVQEDLAAEVYAQLCTKHQRLSEIVESTGEQEETGIQNSSLIKRAMAASRRRDMKEQTLRKGEETVTQLYEKYEQEQAQILMLTVEIVEQYKLQQRQKYEKMKMELLCKKTAGFEKELRNIQKGIREQTYTVETLPALRIVRKHLNAQIQDLSTALAKGKLRVLEYERLGYEFADLARRYKEALTHLEMQKSIYEDLVQDIETGRESVGYNEKWDEVSTSESTNY